MKSKEEQKQEAKEAPETPAVFVVPALVLKTSDSISPEEVLPADILWENGIRCFFGINADKNYNGAIYFFKQAAKQNYAPACAFLACYYMYYRCSVAEDNWLNILLLLQTAADQGEVWSQFVMKCRNKESLPDYVILLKAVISLGETDPLYPGANFSLGLCYLFGWGVNLDRHRAINFFITAANCGNAYAQDILFYLENNEVEGGNSEQNTSSNSSSNSDYLNDLATSEDTDQQENILGQIFLEADEPGQENSPEDIPDYFASVTEEPITEKKPATIFEQKGCDEGLGMWLKEKKDEYAPTEININKLSNKKDSLFNIKSSLLLPLPEDKPINEVSCSENSNF